MSKQTVKAKPAKANKAKGAPANECQCNAEPTKTEGVYAACGRLTAGKFAPGHDAKLKGVLIKAVRAGQPYKTISAGGRVTNQDPHQVAKSHGWSKYTDGAKAVKKATPATKAKPRKDGRGAGAPRKPRRSTSKAKLSVVTDLVPQ